MTAQTQPFPFENHYARLPAQMYARLEPTPVAEPGWIAFNAELANALNLDVEALESPAGLAFFAGNAVPDGAEPLAMAYAGHQFGHWSGQLGDGRALMLGEVTGRDGHSYEIQLKGAGRTPFSRGGDGRAWVGPVIREYIVSEAMAALGVPTTRALAAVTTGERILREGPQPGGIITRVSRGHIRVGSFQYFAATQDQDGLKALADHVIARLWPAAAQADNPYLGLFEQVIAAQAKLVAKWMSLGFIHGVMNTDNASIAGETIDYGPCAFLDVYHPDKVYSSIDHGGRYKYANQPPIAQWNLSVLAQAMLPLFDADEDAAVAKAQSALDAYPELYEAAYLSEMRAKLGLERAELEDAQLIADFLNILAAEQADFTNAFRALSDDAALPPAFADWHTRWQARRAGENAAPRNPFYIPRNHLVEAAIVAAVDGDYQPFNDLLEATTHPYDHNEKWEKFRQPPAPEEEVLQTFCGT